MRCYGDAWEIGFPAVGNDSDALKYIAEVKSQLARTPWRPAQF